MLNKYLFALAAILACAAFLLSLGNHRGAKEQIIPARSDRLEYGLRGPSADLRMYSADSSREEAGVDVVTTRSIGSVLEESEFVYVLFVDSAQRPCPDVMCSLDSPGGRRMSLTSDGLGVVELQRHQSALSNLIVRDPRFSTRVVRFGEELASDYHVVLSPSTSIDGRVVLPNGESPKEGSVIAFEFGKMVSEEFVPSGKFGSLYEADYGAQIQPDGSFSIGGLTAGRTYGLFARGPGFAIDDTRQLPSATAPDSGVDLPASYLYGCELLFTDSNGGSIDLSTALHVAPDGSLRSSPWRISPVVPDDQSSSVLDPDISWTAVLSEFRRLQSSDSGSLPVLIASNEDSETLSCRLTLHHSRYLPVDVQVHVPRLESGPLDQQDVSLGQPNLACGTLLLSIADVTIPRPLSPSSSSESLMVQLTNSDEPGVRLVEAVLGWNDFPEWTISDIPCGEYDLRICSREGGFAVEHGSVSIPFEPEVAKIEVSVAASASIQVNLVDDAENEYTGPASFVLMKRKFNQRLGKEVLVTRETVDQFFLRAPYTFPIVDPGEWAIVLTSPLVSMRSYPRRYTPIVLNAGASLTETIAIHGIR